jgi:hypothetical protein
MYHWTLFSLPENAWFGWQGFLICPTLLCLFLLSLHMVKGIKSQPPCSSLPTMYHWTLYFPSQECFIGNNLLPCPTLSCLFVCLRTLWKGWSHKPLCCVLPSMYHFPHQMLFSVCNMCEFIDTNFNSSGN